MSEFRRGSKMNPPTPEGYPPTPDPSPNREIFSKQKGLMDYINWKDIQRKVAITKDTAYQFILKELLDNAVDYIETHHSRLADAGTVVVSIVKTDKFLKLAVTNTNDGTPAFTEERIKAILDPNSKVSSKRNQFKINKGALGDALKEVFGIPYALTRDAQENLELESADSITTNMEWDEPLIIKNNSVGEEFQIRLDIDRINQVPITRVSKYTHDRKENTTEIEVRVPVIEDTNSLLAYLYRYFHFVTHIDFQLACVDITNNNTKIRPCFVISPHTQPIEKGWKSQTSVYYYTSAQFRDFILELDDDSQVIYEVLYNVFREGSNMRKTSLTLTNVGQIKRSDDAITKLYKLLRDSMKDPPSTLSLPFNVNKKSTRVQALKEKTNRLWGEVSDIKYKSDFGVVNIRAGDGKIKVQIPYFFEIAVMRINELKANLSVNQAINSSAILEGVIFSGKDFDYYPLASKSGWTTSNIFTIFKHYGYSHNDKEVKKKHGFIMMNLISPKIDYESYGKSKIDYAPFIDKVAELTVKACQGGGGRALDGKPSRISIVRKILEERQEQWNSWDNATRQSHWSTMSDVFYMARKKLVEEEGYEIEEIDRETITGYIKSICEDELHVKREDIGIIAADRAQLYFNGQWMDVGLSEIRQLSLIGTDLIIIEKEGMAQQLALFADEYGIALLNTRGFLTDYAAILSEKSEKEGCNISILTDLDASGLLLARAVPNAFRIGIDFDTLNDLGLNVEDVEEKYSPGTHITPLQAGGEHEGVYSDDIIDYVSDKRVEINSVIVELEDNRKFWDWILDKLREEFSERDYTRSVKTTNQDVIPACLEELNNLVKEEDAIIIEPHTDKLHDRLSEIKGGFLFDPTNEVLSNIEGKEEITIPQYQKTIDDHKRHIVNQYSEMQPYWKRIEELVADLKKRKDSRGPARDNNNN